MKPKTKKRVEGVISLMLTIVLLPVLSVTGVVVEANRYQSAQALLSEVMGSAAYSTLASYDPYLLSRFGLLATNQQVDVKDTYQSYLDSNLPLVNNNGLSGVESSASGIYPLTDPDMLYYQIMETGKLSCPTTLVEDLVKLDTVISQLEKGTHVLNIFNGVGEMADCVDTMAQMSVDLEQLKDSCDTLHGIIDTTYQEKYDAFSAAVTTYDTDAAAYIAAKEAAEAAKEPAAGTEETPAGGTAEGSAEGSAEGGTADTSAEDAALAEAQTKFDASKAAAATACTEYKNVLSSYASALGTYKAKIQSYQEHKNAQLQNLVDLGKTGSDIYMEFSDLKEDKNKSPDETKEEKEQREQAEALQDATHKKGVSIIQDGTQGMINRVDEHLEGYLDADLDPYIKEANDIIAELEKVSFELKEDGTAPVVTVEDYKIASFPDIVTSDKVQSVLDETQKEVDQPDLITVMKSLVEVFNAVIDFEGTIDTELNAGINEDYYTTNCGGLPSTRMQKAGFNQSDLTEAQANIKEINQATNGVQNWLSKTGVPSVTGSEIMQNLQDFMSAVSEVTAPFTLLSVRIANMAKALRSMANLFNNIMNCIRSLHHNLRSIIAEKVVFNQYLIKMLPNRLNYSSGKAMNGYSFSSIALKPAAPIPNGIEFVPSIGTLMVGGSQILQKYAGQDTMFCGAELEYVLHGSLSEYENQASVYMLLYLYRLIIDLISVAANPFIHKLAGCHIPGWIAIGVIAVAEPMLSTLLLVNDGEVPVFKKDIYLSPAGLPDYIGKIASVKKLEKIIKGTKFESELNKLNNLPEPSGQPSPSPDTGEAGKEPDKKGIFSWKDYGESLISMDYEDHLLLHMCLFMNRENALNHLADIIAMEAEGYYQDQNKVKHFDLGQSFTFVRSEVSGSVNQIMPIPTLSSRSLLNTRVLQYRGY